MFMFKDSVQLKYWKQISRALEIRFYDRRTGFLDRRIVTYFFNDRYLRQRNIGTKVFARRFSFSGKIKSVRSWRLIRFEKGVPLPWRKPFLTIKRASLRYEERLSSIWQDAPFICKQQLSLPSPLLPFGQWPLVLRGGEASSPLLPLGIPPLGGG